MYRKLQRIETPKRLPVMASFAVLCRLPLRRAERPPRQNLAQEAPRVARLAAGAVLRRALRRNDAAETFISG